MRLILILMMVAVAVVTLAAPDAVQAQLSFFNKRYCLGSMGKVPDCSYNTWEQCRASVSGAEFCSENSFWKPDQPAKREPKRRR